MPTFILKSLISLPSWIRICIRPMPGLLLSHSVFIVYSQCDQIQPKWFLDFNSFVAERLTDITCHNYVTSSGVFSISEVIYLRMVMNSFFL